MMSFAQNFEDVILARVFGSRQHGSYVDVGAHFPIIDSVTEHFYRLGWRGINVEPLDAAFGELCATRPEDLNLHCAVGADDGTSRFFALDGFSTLDERIATAHHAEGRQSKEMIVATSTLASVMRRLDGRPIDFLKVDVEGAEVTVLKSNDWQRFRPAIVLVEAIHPVSHAPSHEEWEWVLREAGYDGVHFDGVNRFYWNTELARPDPSCFLPPNALDHFTVYSQIAAEARASESARIAQYEHQRCVDLETAAAARAEAGRRQLAGIDAALQQFATNADTPAPLEAVQAGWDALKAVAATRQATEDAVLLQLGEDLHALAAGDDATVGYPALQRGWQAIKDARGRSTAEYEARLARRDAATADMQARQAAEIAALQAQLAACRAACGETRTLLEVSERRRLAVLESGTPTV